MHDTHFSTWKLFEWVAPTKFVHLILSVYVSFMIWNGEVWSGKLKGVKEIIENKTSKLNLAIKNI